MAVAKSKQQDSTPTTPDQHQETAPDVSLGDLWNVSKSIAWRTLDTVDRSTAIVHRSVVILDDRNQIRAQVTRARHAKLAQQELAEIDKL